MKRRKTMRQWINENSGLIGVISPIVLGVLIIFASQMFLTKEWGKQHENTHADITRVLAGIEKNIAVNSENREDIKQLKYEVINLKVEVAELKAKIK